VIAFQRQLQEEVRAAESQRVPGSRLSPALLSDRGRTRQAEPPGAAVPLAAC